MKRMNFLDYLSEIDWEEVYTDIFVEFEYESFEVAKSETERIYNKIREEYANGEITAKEITKRIYELIG